MTAAFDRRTAALAAGLFLALVGTSAARTPDFPVPPDTTAEWVSDTMNWNGVDMAVRRFESTRSVDRIVDFYRSRWLKGTDGEAGYRIAEADPWTIISRLEEGKLLTVQVQRSGRKSSWGYLAISDLPDVVEEQAFRELGKGFPRMRGSHVMTDVRSDDPGKAGRTLHFVNEFSLQSNLDFYRIHYLENGWSSRMDLGDASEHVLSFGRTGHEISLVFRRSDGATSVVANSVERE